MHRQTLDGEHNYWLGIVSRARSDQVGYMTRQIGSATWYVPHDEHLDKYYEAAAKESKEEGVPISIKVQTAPGLPQARNDILEDAFERDLVAVMSDDDMRTARQAHHSMPTRWRTLSWEDIIVLMFNRKKDYPKFKLSSFRADAMPLGYAAPIANHIKAIASMFMVEPSTPRFKPEYVQNEDYDFWLQHMREYKGVVINHDLMLAYQHWGNPGGVVDERSNEDRDALAAKIYSYFERDWGAFVSPHSGRWSGPNDAFKIRFRYAEIKRQIYDYRYTAKSDFLKITESQLDEIIELLDRYESAIGRVSSTSEMIAELILERG